MNSLPPLKATQQYADKVSLVQEGAYGVPDNFRNGLQTARGTVGAANPVEIVQLTHNKNQDDIRLSMLGAVQGGHMPMRIQMERVLVSKPVHHMPCIPHSNAAMETILGKDETIDFTDYLNDPRIAERMGDPHRMMEHKLGMN